MPYQVELDAFHGPLDLLLHLVKKEEVDVLDVPISRLADQFLTYLGTMRELDVEFAGDFIVMAATLMEIKSRSLLPDTQAETVADEPDPRRELVRQLMEYRKFKDAATALELRAEERTTKVARTSTDEPTAATPATVRSVELWDLVSAFARLMRETQDAKPQTLVVDETPQHVYEAYILERLQSEGPLPFLGLFTQPHHRARLIGLFLAILEMIKSGLIWLEQIDHTADIRISIRIPTSST